MEYYAVSDWFWKGRQVNRYFAIKIQIARKDFNKQLCLIRCIIDHLLHNVIFCARSLNKNNQYIWRNMTISSIFSTAIFVKWSLKKLLENVVERKWPEMNLWYLSGRILNLKKNYLLLSVKIFVQIPPCLSSYNVIFRPLWWTMPFK